MANRTGVVDVVADVLRMKRTEDFAFELGTDFEKLEPDYGIETQRTYELPALPRKLPINFALDVEEAQRFLSALDPDAERFTFQSFTDGKHKPHPDPLQNKWNERTLSYFLEGAESYQRKGAGLFVQVNAGQRGAQNVTHPRALFADDDRKNHALDLSKCPPSITVESSLGKRQYYWLLVEADRTVAALPRWKEGQEQLIAALGTDPKMKNRDRVLRLPGTLHLKNRAAPHRVCILDFHPERLYSIDTVIAAYPATVKKRKVVKQFQDRGEFIELADELGLLDHNRKCENNGIHGVCPNADKHSNGDADCVYYPPDVEKGQTLGYVHCFHAHCEDIGVFTMLDLLKKKAPRLKTRPERWLLERLQRMKVTYSAKNDTILMNGEPHSLPAFINILQLDGADDRIKAQLVDAAFSLWLEKQRADTHVRFRNQMGWAPDNEPRLKAWMAAVTGRIDACDMAVMEHFMWQVKRKLHGLPVEHHMMPIFVGKQGGGKSTAVRKLLEPIQDGGLMASCHDLRLIEDDRHIARYATKLVVLCDEMTKVTKTDIAALKGFITEETASWRIMKTTLEARAANLATFIGTANPNVIDLINDPTGMRRFYEIHCQDLLLHDTINAIDYMRLWQSVDHRGASPIVPYLDTVKRRQEGITAQHSVDEWLELRCQWDDSVDEWIRASDAYQEYADWMRLQRRAPESERAFCRRLVSKGVQSKKISTMRYRMRIPTALLTDIEVARLKKTL